MNAIGMIFFAAISMAVGDSSAAQACNDRQDVTTNINSSKDISLHAWSCKVESAKYIVSLELRSPHKTQMIGTISAMGSAFSLSIDNSIDLDGDGVADVGVTNGGGRAEDGMSYWLLTKYPLNLVFVGDAPPLTKVEGASGELRALIPGSGEIQATLVYYVFDKRQLRESMAIQFTPDSEDRYRLQELLKDKISPDWTIGGSLFVPALDAQNCMSGGRCPWFIQTAK